MTTVLFVVSAADHWTLKDGSQHPTGFWAEELAEPHRIFTEAGFELTLATPGGQVPVVDKLSLGLMGGTPAKRQKIRAYLDKISGWLESPMQLAKVDESEFDLVFYPGGHGPMEDLAVDLVSGALLRNRLLSDRPLALLCHAPAAVLAAHDENGHNPFAGRTLTALSNVEERMNYFSWKARWLLETELKDAGINYQKATFPYREHVVTDRNLYTGQNPQSSVELAELLVQKLKQQ